jgi:hypothetical protein
MGGTCAVDLTVMHPEMFSAFVDIAGDYFPNAGNKTQTIARLFGGNADAWATFDPTTVIDRHGPYNARGRLVRDLVGQGTAVQRRDFAMTDAGSQCGWSVARPPPTRATRSAAAYSLCALGRANGIDCAVVAQTGKHDWPFADRVLRGGAALARRPAGLSGGPAQSRCPRVVFRRRRPGTTVVPARALPRRQPVTALLPHVARIRRAIFARHCNPWSAWTRWASTPLTTGSRCGRGAGSHATVARAVAGGQSVRLRQSRPTNAPGQLERCWARNCGSADRRGDAAMLVSVADMLRSR